MLGCVFAEDDQIVTCGVDHIFFWLKEDKGTTQHQILPCTFTHV